MNRIRPSYIYPKTLSWEKGQRERVLRKIQEFEQSGWKRLKIILKTKLIWFFQECIQWLTTH